MFINAYGIRTAGHFHPESELTYLSLLMSIQRLTEKCANTGFDAQFLTQFTLQTLFRGFSRINFASRELPLVGKAVNCGPLSDEYPVFMLHKRRSNLDNRWKHQLRTTFKSPD